MYEGFGITDACGRPLFTMRADLFGMYLNRLGAASEADDGEEVYDIVLGLREELEAAIS